MVSADPPPDKPTDQEEVYADSSVVATFTLEDARALKVPTDKLLCTLADNRYIQFKEYSVVDYDSRTKLLHVDGKTNVMMDQMAR